jgi:hypothetical protein
MKPSKKILNKALACKKNKFGLKYYKEIKTALKKCHYKCTERAIALS